MEKKIVCGKEIAKHNGKRDVRQLERNSHNETLPTYKYC